MITELQSKIGELSAITITSPNLLESLTFYEQFGFKEVLRSDFPFRWIQVSDGALLMMIREDNNPHIALTYYINDIENKVAEFENNGVHFKELSVKTDMIKRYLTTSPDGLNISLVTFVDGFTKPAGPTMLNMEQQDYFNPEKYVNKTIGMFGELAHPVKDLEQSIIFGEKLGFKTISKYTSPYPWAILSDGTSVIGCHQSTHFSSPAITYFAKDMKDKIQVLKENGLEYYKEMMGPTNIIITTPEGQQLFLFSMG